MALREGYNLSEEDTKLYDEFIRQSEYFDRLQYVYKIKLNSQKGA